MYDDLDNEWVFEVHHKSQLQAASSTNHCADGDCRMHSIPALHNIMKHADSIEKQPMVDKLGLVGGCGWGPLWR